MSLNKTWTSKNNRRTFYWHSLEKSQLVDVIEEDKGLATII